jgi:uncharacterized protein YndB with AHSA1/START domain
VASAERLYGKLHHLDARVGGTYRMSLANFATGRRQSFGATYLELVPGERIRHTDKFDDPNLRGETETTVSLSKVSCGPEVNMVQEEVPEAIPTEGCYLRLARFAYPPRTASRS